MASNPEFDSGDNYESEDDFLGATFDGLDVDTDAMTTPLDDDEEGGSQKSLFQKDGQPLRYRYFPRTEGIQGAIDAAASHTHAEPSEAQKEAGNFKKGRFSWHGMQIVIECPKGGRRKPEWPELTAHYGFVAASKSGDYEPVDVFLGPDPESELVYVVDQVTESGKWDEHKAILGCTSTKEARELYLSHYPSGWKCGTITPLTAKAFRAWLEEGDTEKPIAPQVSKYAKAAALYAERYARKKPVPAGQKAFGWNEDEHPRGQPENKGEFAPQKDAAPAEEPFSLTPEKPASKPTPKDFGSTGGQQSVLIQGQNDLPGQMDILSDMGVETEHTGKKESPFKVGGQSASDSLTGSLRQRLGESKIQHPQLKSYIDSQIEDWLSDVEDDPEPHGDLDGVNRESLEDQILEEIIEDLQGDMGGRFQPSEIPSDGKPIVTEQQQRKEQDRQNHNRQLRSWRKVFSAAKKERAARDATRYPAAPQDEYPEEWTPLTL
jgi:hypothetical protein